LSLFEGEQKCAVFVSVSLNANKLLLHSGDRASRACVLLPHTDMHWIFSLLCSNQSQKDGETQEEVTTCKQHFWMVSWWIYEAYV